MQISKIQAASRKSVSETTEHMENKGSSLCQILLQDPGPGCENHPSAEELPGGKGFLMPEV